VTLADGTVVTPVLRGGIAVTDGSGGGKVAGGSVLAHALSSAHAIAATGSTRIDFRNTRNASSRFGSKELPRRRYVARGCEVPEVRRRPFDPVTPRGGPRLRSVRASSKGKRRRVIVVVGILTVLVLAWLLFRAEARRR
jgi:hypothetical protein